MAVGIKICHIKVVCGGGWVVKARGRGRDAAGNGVCVCGHVNLAKT